MRKKSSLYNLVFACLAIVFFAACTEKSAENNGQKKHENVDLDKLLSNLDASFDTKTRDAVKFILIIIVVDMLKILV